jgi:hypothetical protein
MHDETERIGIASQMKENYPGKREADNCARGDDLGDDCAKPHVSARLAVNTGLAKAKRTWRCNILVR